MKRFIDATVRLLPGIALVFALAIGGKVLSDWLQSVIVINWVRSLASNVIIAIVGGMIIGNLVPLPKFFSPGIAAYEFFLKVGIVIMGARSSSQTWRGWGAWVWPWSWWKSSSP